jgi:hypothetical protein
MKSDPSADTSQTYKKTLPNVSVWRVKSRRLTPQLRLPPFCRVWDTIEWKFFGRKRHIRDRNRPERERF